MTNTDCKRLQTTVTYYWTTVIPSPHDLTVTPSPHDLWDNLFSAEEELRNAFGNVVFIRELLS